MKAIEVATFGGPEQLILLDKPLPEPGPGQVLIEVKAAGINFADLRAREGRYPRGPQPPFIPGNEAAGIVAALGQGVTAPAAGTRVMVFLTGGYAEYAVADAAQTIPLPNTVDYAPATTLLVQGLTAYFLLKRAAPLRKGALSENLTKRPLLRNFLHPLNCEEPTLVTAIRLAMDERHRSGWFERDAEGAGLRLNWAGHGERLDEGVGI